MLCARSCGTHIRRVPAFDGGIQEITILASVTADRFKCLMHVGDGILGTGMHDHLTQGRQQTNLVPQEVCK